MTNPLWPDASVRRHVIRRLLVLPLCLSLAGCMGALLPQPAEEAATHSYLLEWSGDARPAMHRADGPSLLIAPMRAAPGFDTRDMAYTRHAHELEYFTRHRWVDAPARMLEPLLLQAAEQTGLLRSVSAAGSGAQVDLRLDSSLLYLRQVCRLEPSELQLGVRASLIEVSSGRVIDERTLTVSEPLEVRTPYAGVQAANRALARLLAELQDWLAEQIGASRRRG